MGQKRVTAVTTDPIASGFSQSTPQVAEIDFAASGDADIPLFTSAPFGFRILRAEAEITKVAAQSGSLYSAAGGTGTRRSGAIDGTVAGLNVEAPAASLGRTVAAGEALYFKRTSNAIAGKLRIWYVPT